MMKFMVMHGSKPQHPGFTVHLCNEKIIKESNTEMQERVEERGGKRQGQCSKRQKINWVQKRSEGNRSTRHAMACLLTKDVRSACVHS